MSSNLLTSRAGVLARKTEAELSRLRAAAKQLMIYDLRPLARAAGWAVFVEAKREVYARRQLRRQLNRQTRRRVKHETDQRPT